MVTDCNARPRKGAAKRKGNQKTLRERRDVDIMNVRLSSIATSTSFPAVMALTQWPDK